MAYGPLGDFFSCLYAFFFPLVTDIAQLLHVRGCHRVGLKGVDADVWKGGRRCIESGLVRNYERDFSLLY